MNPTILVLGGGIGGIRTARKLATKLGNEEGVRVGRILVFEKEPLSLYYPSLTWLMVGKRQPYQVQQDLSKSEREGLEIVYGDIQKIDPTAKSVTVNGTTFAGDYMILSLGTEQTARPELATVGHNFYTVQGAESFFKQLDKLSSGHIAVVVSSLPHKSPVAPYEAALLIDNYLEDKGIRAEFDISLVTPETKPMEFTSLEVSEKIKELLASKGIRYTPNFTFSEAMGSQLVFKNATGASFELTADLMAFTPDHVCPKVVVDSGLSGTSGWVETDHTYMKTSFEGVYAIGDITSFILPNGKELPKAGIFAEQQADVVAHNISRLIQGHNPDAEFSATGGYILDSGSSASKVSGDFDEVNVAMGNHLGLRHWEKVLMEKTWFLKNFG
jgi:sulfide:quinone oxidoreductase